MYELSGQFMSYCIVHNGPLPQILHPQLYTALSDGYCLAEPDLDDIKDLDPLMYATFLKV